MYTCLSMSISTGQADPGMPFPKHSSRFMRRARTSRRRTITALALAVLVLGGPNVQGDTTRLGPNEAVERVREHTQGRILGVDARDGDTFRIRVLVRPGEVQVFEVDRRTGAVRY